MLKNKNILILSALLAGFIFSGNAFANETITIAASPVPHAEILKQVVPILAKEGVDLKIKEFTDYVTPNLVVDQKQLDANFFQHRPYLKEFNKEHGTNLVELTGVEVEPMGLYTGSNAKYKNFAATKSVKVLPHGAIIGIPNDTTNEGRALLLLQEKGLIKIKSGVVYPTKDDITANPYDLSFKELDAAMLPRALLSKQLDLAIINSNYAIESGMNPLKDAVYIENSKSPYVNIVVVRPDELKEPKMQKLAKALHSALVKQFILTKYKGAVIPAL